MGVQRIAVLTSLVAFAGKFYIIVCRRYHIYPKLSPADKILTLLQNAPYIFTTVWSVIKGWLDPVTVEKIKILGSGYEKELKEHVGIVLLMIDT